MADATDNVLKTTSPQIINAPHVENKEVDGGETPYIMPRQTGTGTTRGTQNISGKLTITDPATGVVRLVAGYAPGEF